MAPFCLFSAHAASGTVIDGAISVPGERDAYSFIVESETRFYFDALSNLSRLNWSLTGPTGTIIANRSFVSSDGQSIGDATFLLQPGSYTITIQDSDGSTDPYSFRVLKFSDAALLSTGVAVSGDLVPANSTDLYQFTASAGDVFVFDQISRTGIPNSYWKLYDPYGNILFNQGFGSDVGTVANPIRLSATGTYVLAIEGYIGDSNASGSYSFNVIPQGNVAPTPFTGTALTLGQTVSGNHTAGGTNSYIFTLGNSTFVAFDTLISSPSLAWTLQGPSGIVVNQRSFNSSDGFYNFGPWRLPAGSYQLRITGNAADAFQFRLLDLAAATTVAFNTPTTAALNPATATVAYRFDGNRDDKLFFNSTAVTGLPNTYWRLIDPQGSFVFGSGISTDQGRITLQLTGTYYLLVEGYVADSGNGSFSFNIVNPIDALDALTLGSVVSDSIDVPGEQHQYTFNITSATRLYFDSRSNTSQLLWSLTGPGGSIVNNRGFNQSDAQNNSTPLVPVTPGSYTLTVSASGDNTGPYSFRLFDTANSENMTPGSLISDSLTPANSSKFYKFTAGANGRYYFDSQGISGLPNAVIRIFDSHNIAFLNQGLGSDAGPFSLPAGDYLLLVEGYIAEAGSGSFSLNLLPATLGDQALSFNTTQVATIAQPGASQQFTFTVSTEGDFYFDSWTNRGNFHWTLANSTGVVVNNRSFSSSDAQSIAESVLHLLPGNYTLTVSANADEIGSGIFRFLDLNSSAVPLTPGTEVSGALNPANSTQVYSFTVAAEGKYFFNRTASSGMSSGWVRLIDPHSHQLISGSFDSDVGPLKLLPGKYRLLVEGNIGQTGSATYSFNFLPVIDGANVLTLGDPVSGSIASPGQQQVYTFSLASAARLYFDSRSNSNLRWALTGALGSYADRPFNGSDAQSQIPFLDLPGGDYTLTVRANGDATGSYEFRLFDVATATVMTPGTPVTANLSPANSTLAYRFNVSTAGVYYFDAQTVSTLPNTWLRLTGPGNALFLNTSAVSDAGPFALVPGAYYLYVEGYIADQNNGSLTFNLLPVGDGSQSLVLGSLVNGNISNPGQSQRYTFALATGARLYFDSRLNSSQLRWSLDGPLGNVVANRIFSNSDAQNISAPILDLPAGNYTLTVNASADTTGAYQFRLFDLASATVLTPGVTTSNNSFIANSTDAYRFVAAAGDEFQFVRIASTAIPNAYWRLINPLGGITFAQGFGSNPGTLTLPIAGTYTLLIEGYIGDAGTGSYSINVGAGANTPPTPFTGSALTLGTTVSGNLATTSAIDAYTFTLAAPARLYFDSLTSAPFVWTLEGRTGVIIANRSFQNSDSADTSDPRVYLPAGDYRLRVTGVAGAYQFRLLDFTSATPMTPGTPLVTTLGPANSTMLYKFDGIAGAQFYLDGQGSVPGPGGGSFYEPYLRLFGPLGDIVTGQTGNSDVDTFTLAQTGTYVLAVEGRIYDQHTRDTNTLVLVPVIYPTNALTFGASVNATIATPGIRHYYTFTLASAATLYFDALTKSDFYWRLDGPTGQVMNWRTFVSSDAGDVSDPALRLPPGAYTLTVAGNNFTTLGDYGFRLLDLSAGPSISLGSVVTTTLTPANSSKVYHFNATAGDLYYFDGQGFTDTPGTGSSYSPYVRIYTPSGSIVMAQNVNNQVDTFRLPETGAYTLVVEGRVYSERASSDSAFRLIPITYPTDALTLGATVNGTLSTPGIRHSYTFTLNSSTTIYFDALSNDTFYWRLDAPWGQIIDWRCFQASDGGDISNPFIRLEPGAYTLTVAGSNFRTTGDYSFRFGDITTGSVLTPGTPVATTLAPANSTVFYKFNATAGTQFYFDGLGFTNDPPGGSVYVAQVRMLSPSGQIVLSQSVSGDVDTFKLNESGTYIVAVEGRIYDTHTSQANGFNLIPITNPTTALTFGTTVTGTIPTAGVRNMYTFTLLQPSLLEFDSLSNVSMSWRLDAPWGTVIDWRGFQGSDSVDISDSLLALDAGPYTLTVAGNGFVATGDYSFRLLSFASASPMTPGTAVSGTLAPAVATALYKFTGNAGDRYYFDGRGSTGFSYQPIVRLYSPFGRRIFSQTVNLDIDTFQLPDPGTYTVAVEGRIFESGPSGTFNFDLQPLPAPTSTPLFGGGNPPDLIAQNISVTPSTGIQSGGAVTIHWTDQNTGAGSVVDSFTDRVTIRNSSQAVLADTVVTYALDSVGNGPITSGTGRARQATLTLPDGPAATGTLQVTIVADALNAVSESNEGNNASTASFSASLAPYPDLIVENVSAAPSQRWNPGSTVTVNWRVRNVGNGDANTDFSENVVVRNSASTVIAARSSNYTVSAQGNGAIAAGAFRDRSATFTVPNDNTAFGLFTITVTTDVGQTVFEYNAASNAELNNSASAQFLSAPDLAPAGVSVSAVGPVMSGSMLTIQWTNQNIGTADLT
ncbi:MAG TPA: CARDB domain-containing protein, partial [Verrucomicrobiae bacterium]